MQTALLMQAEPPPLEGVFAVNPEPPDAEPAHEPVEEKPDTKPPQPVSKWTLGDYDEPADDKWVSGTYVHMYICIGKLYMFICRKRVHFCLFLLPQSSQPAEVTASGGFFSYQSHASQPARRKGGSSHHSRTLCVHGWQPLCNTMSLVRCNLGG